MTSSQAYLKTVESRRTIYNLKPELPKNVTLDDIQKAIQTVIRDTPTAHNSQVNRAIIITGDAHKKAWDCAAKNVPMEIRKTRAERARDEAYGTIIFYTDDDTTKKLQEAQPQYAEYFPRFADQVSGAAQISSWNALHELGLGAHLQHYNEFIEGALPTDVPSSWSMYAQLVFGSPAAPPNEKAYIENNVQVYK